MCDVKWLCESAGGDWNHRTQEFSEDNVVLGGIRGF